MHHYTYGPHCAVLPEARALHAALPLVAGDDAIALQWLYSRHHSVPDVPFRAPHHTVSAWGLCGSPSHPGEVSLALGGVLLLDQVEEFGRATLERLGHALRSGRSGIWPARPAIVVTTSLPCPCGRPDRCRCTVGMITRHNARVARNREMVQC